MSKISMIGSGSWAIALSSVLANNNHEVLVYARRKEETDLLNKGYSSYYKNQKLNFKIKATNDFLKAINFSDIIIISIPIATIYDLFKDIINKYPNKIYVVTSKGLYKGKSISTLFFNINPNINYGCLSGPSFASEVFIKKNTAIVIASNKIEVAKNLQVLFNNNYFKVYTQNDIIGVEYCGAIKNVFAIICGMIDGNNMGTNTKHAIITRGLNEISKVIEFVGGNHNTLYGLAGIGDIMLTCNSMQSRNYSYGYNYNQNSSLDYNQKGTIEGLNTIKEIYEIAKNNNIDMPIINSLYNILFKNSNIEDETKILMQRAMKGEN